LLKTWPCHIFPNSVPKIMCSYFWSKSNGLCNLAPNSFLVWKQFRHLEKRIIIWTFMFLKIPIESVKWWLNYAKAISPKSYKRKIPIGICSAPTTSCIQGDYSFSSGKWKVRVKEYVKFGVRTPGKWLSHLTFWKFTL
jgi:hypothetical protein